MFLEALGSGASAGPGGKHAGSGLARTLSVHIRGFTRWPPGHTDIYRTGKKKLVIGWIITGQTAYRRTGAIGLM
jgi:hypothetical protein